MRYPFIGIWQLLFLFIGLTLKAQQHCYTHISTRDGLPSSTIYNCLQDYMGYMWICTETGLAKYDGNRFVTYDANQGIINNEIISVAEDNTHKIWFSCFSDKNSLLYFKNKKIVSSDADTILAPYSDFTFIQSILIDSVLFVASRKGLIEIHSGVPTFRILRGIDNLFQTNDKQLLAVTSHIPGKDSVFYTLYRNQNFDTIGVFPKQFYNKEYFFNDILYLIRGTDIQLYKFEKSHFTYLKTIKTHLPISKLFVSNSGIWLIVEREHTLYYSRSMDNLEKGHYIKSLSAADVVKIYEDKQQNTWVCTNDKGIFLLKNLSIYQFPISDSGSNVIRSIYRSSDNLIAAGTDNGRLILFNHNLKIQQKIPLYKERPTRNRTLQIESYQDKFLVANDEAVWKINYPKITKLFPSNSKSFCMLNDSLVMLGIGQWSRLFNINTNQCLQTIATNRIFSQAKQNDSIMWLAGLEGLKEYNFLRQQEIKSDLPPIECRINSILFQNGMLWIGTNTMGILRLSNHKIIDTLTTDKLPLQSNNIIKIRSDRQHIYVATINGYLKIFIDAHNKIIRSEPYSMTDGIPTGQINDLTAYNDTCYLATNDGLILVDEKNIQRKKLQLNFDEISIDQQPIFKKANISLYDHQKLNISFIGIEIAGSSKIRYEYKLSPLSQTWETISQKNLSFTSLYPGHYTLYVRAHSANDYSTATIELPFEIKHKWYQTWLALIIGGLILATLLFLFIFWFRKYTRLKAEKKSALKHRMVLSELEALRSQMNPHFIFNSMNVMQDLIMQNQPLEATQFVSKFSKLIRNTLQLSKRNWIYLNEEIDFLEQYIRLEQIRFHESFTYSIKVKNIPDISHIEVPSLLIQPFVENAINHGIKYLGEHEKGLLQIEFSMEDEHLSIRINDNGIGIIESKQVKNKAVFKHNSLGMNITHDRIELINENFNTKILCAITDKSELTPPERGTLVHIKIPTHDV